MAGSGPASTTGILDPSRSTLLTLADFRFRIHFISTPCVSCTPCCALAIQRSIDFYTQVMGARPCCAPPTGQTSNTPWPSWATAATPTMLEIELTYNYGVSHYELGTAYGPHCGGRRQRRSRLRRSSCQNGRIRRCCHPIAGPVKGGQTVIAFITDPDGYKIELIERPDAAAELNH